VNIAAINRDSVLHAIRAGNNTRADLADLFQVLPTFRSLTDVIDALLDSREVVEHEGGVLHVNDLTEQLPHEPEEGK
jgi:hypothetical protein